MLEAMPRLIAKGGLPTRMLMLAFVVWLIALVVLVIWQRRRLARAVDAAAGDFQFAAAAPLQPALEAAVARFRDGLGRAAGGRGVLFAVIVWWTFCLALLVWSVTANVDIFRLHVQEYRDVLGWEENLRLVARRQASVNITRSFLGMLGVAATAVSLLALDQALSRPRTRLLEALRWRLLAVAVDHPERPALARSLEDRARATWSWQAAGFTWLWLGARRLLVPAVAVVVLLVVLPELVAPLTAKIRGLAPYDPWDPELTRAELLRIRLWVPLLTAAVRYLPPVVVAIGVGALAHRWRAGRRARELAARAAASDHLER